MRKFKTIFHCNAKYLALRVNVGHCPRRQNFAFGIPTCWYLGANANPFCVLPDAFYPTPKPKFAFYPTPKPNASQWNIGCIGSLALGLCVGHIHFIFWVLISFALGSRRKRSFQWNIGLRPKIYPFFQNRGHTKFRKIDPFSVESRTMMRTNLLFEWRDWAGPQPRRRVF